MTARTPLWILYGVAGFFGALALLALFTGSWGAGLALAVLGLGFAGFGWAYRRLWLRREGEGPGLSAGLVAFVLFGGAGLVMVVGSGFLLADGELGGLALTAFGLVFCGAGYLARKVFTPPAGTKEVLVSQAQRTFDNAHEGRGTVVRERYVRVDQDMSEAEIQAKQREWTQRPWTQRPDWAAGAIQQEDHVDLRLLVGFTIAWNVLAGVFAGAELADKWAQGLGEISWIPMLFPAIGVVLAVITVRTWLRQHKFGTSILRCPTVPAWLGDHLRGTVETSLAASRGRGQAFRLRLACLRERTYSDSRGHDHTETEVLWEREASTQPALDFSRKLHLPVDLALPADLPATVMPPRHDRTLWRLTVSRELPGVDYRAVFEVPVFRKEVAATQASDAGAGG